MSSADPLQHLGVRTGPDGGTIRVWSEHATAVELVVFDPNLDWATSRTPLEPGADGVWDRDIRALLTGAIRPAVRSARDRARVQPRAPSSTRGRGACRWRPTDRGAASCSTRSPRGLRLGRCREAPRPARPRRRIRDARARVQPAQRAHPGAVARHVRGTGARRVARVPDGLGVTTVELLLQSSSRGSGSSARVR